MSWDHRQGRFCETDRHLSSGQISLPFAGAGSPVETASVVIRADDLSGFVAGPENALASTLAQAIVPSRVPFSPLVLYGPPGVGKSTLAHALVARRQELHPTEILINTTGADLARGLAQAIESDSVANFRSRHLRCNVLVVDDVQQLAGKAPAQHFLQTAVETLVRRGSLVLVTLAEPPQRTAGLAATLISRLSAGLVVSLVLPGMAARKELVRRAAARLAMPLPDELVAQLIGTDDRAVDGFSTPAQLQHAVMQLGAWTQTRDGAAQESVRQLLSQESRDTTSISRKVTQLVAKTVGLTLSQLKSQSRRQAVAEARSLAMYVTRRITGASYAEIGRCFGGRDHTTVLYACRKVTKAMNNDDALRRTADEIVTQIATGR